MKVFISWSGIRSRELALALHGWLPMVLQAAQPWISSADLQAGESWVREIQFQLRETRVGIVCLTPENLNAPWILHETGALFAQASVVIPYLLGFESRELSGPLAQFQAVRATWDGTIQLVQSVNRILGDQGVDDRVLCHAFERSWPLLESQLNRIQTTEVQRFPPKKQARAKGRTAIKTERKLLEEILRQVSAAPRTVEREAPRHGEPFVFIVHGHDHGAKDTVARFVEKLRAKVVILHEQPDQGRTIIEKFEQHSDVLYAIVLLTGDDRGASRNTPYKKQSLRARQNVILELGFFLAQLGRNRVGVVHEEGVEVPSDYSGVLYIPFDAAGAWRFLLARELRTAGLNVDLNDVL